MPLPRFQQNSIQRDGLKHPRAYFVFCFMTSPTPRKSHAGCCRKTPSPRLSNRTRVVRRPRRVSCNAASAGRGNSPPSASTPLYTYTSSLHLTHPPNRQGPSNELGRPDYGGRLTGTVISVDRGVRVGRPSCTGRSTELHGSVDRVVEVGRPTWVFQLTEKNLSSCARVQPVNFKKIAIPLPPSSFSCD